MLSAGKARRPHVGPGEYRHRPRSIAAASGVNEHYQTAKSPTSYAVGDVIGFPSLASTSMEQGRMAASHAFGIEHHSFPELFPYGIYAIPEISTVGSQRRGPDPRPACPTKSGKPITKRSRVGRSWAIPSACSS